MKVGELTWRKPITIDVAASISVAAELLSDEGVGALVVVDDDRPVGVVTDRDIVTRGVAKGVSPDGRIDGLMSMGVIALDAHDDVGELFATFALNAIRRVPVVDHDRVVGVVSLDDLLVSTAGELSDLVGVLSTQIAFPQANREPPVPARVGD